MNTTQNRAAVTSLLLRYSAREIDEVMLGPLDFPTAAEATAQAKRISDALKVILGVADAYDEIAAAPDPEEQRFPILPLAVGAETGTDLDEALRG